MIRTRLAVAAFAAAAIFASVGAATAEDIPFGFSMSVGPDGPSFSMSVGDQPAPSPASKACFFKGSNYNGPSFCVAVGTEDNHLGGSWDDNISSIKLYGDAEVTVCKGSWFNGSCTTYHSSKPTLSASWNNKISSFATHL